MSTRIVPISGPLEPKGEHVSFDLSLTPLCGACEPFDHQNLLEPIALNSRLPFAEAVLEQPSDVEGVRCHNHLLRRDVIIPRVIFDEPVPRRVRHNVNVNWVFNGTHTDAVGTWCGRARSVESWVGQHDHEMSDSVGWNEDARGRTRTPEGG